MGFPWEILRHLQSIDAGINDLIMDGKIHRFGRKDVYWYTIHQFQGSRGDTVSVCLHGDWRTGERFKYAVSDRGYGVSEKSVTKYFVQQNKVVDEAEKELNEQVSREAMQWVPNLPTTGVSEYLTRKQIDDVDDPRLRYQGFNILVPMRDVEGKIWGGQRIFNNRQTPKLFMKGQKVKGCFHLIGEMDDSPIVYVCEGYATGASIRKATGACVVVAFNSGNLDPVVKQLYPRLRDKRWVICADDDHELLHRHPFKNVGIEKATEIAEAIGARVAIPMFANPDNRGTDFNDLHCIEGIEAVKQQFISDFQDYQPETVVNYATVMPAGTEELTVSELALRILLKRSFKTDLYGQTYEYNGRYWHPVTKHYLENQMIQYDNRDVTSPGRVEKIAKAVVQNSVDPNITWRNIPDHLVPVENGCVDIRQFELKPHNEKHYLESVIPHRFDKEATCPTWERCLDQWFGDDEAKRKCLQQFFGYVLMPHAKWKKALILYGESNTGKSVVGRVLRDLVGQDKTCGIPIDDMGDPKGLAPIKGKQLNLLPELDGGALIKDGGFKSLISGGDTIMINEKYKPQMQYKPFAKHVFITNTLPAINDRSNGTYKRLIVLEFTRVFNDKTQNNNLSDLLVSELEGILQWALIGANEIDSLDGDFIEPEVSRQILEAHKKDGNELSWFVEDCLQRCEASNELFSDVYDRYVRWNKGNLNLGRTTFAKMLNACGFSLAYKRPQYALSDTKKRYVINCNLLPG